MKNHMKIFWFITFHKKTLIGAKLMHIRFDKVEGFMRVCYGTRHSVLFGPEKYDVIYNRVDIL